MSVDTLEKTFTVSLPARLKLSNICGSVEIRPGEDGEIHVTAVKRPHSGDAERTEIEMPQEADGRVTVVTRFPEGAWGWLFGSHPCCVDYTIRAPRQCSLTMDGVSSTLEAEGFAGEFSVNSVSGDMVLRDLTGDLRLHTVSGEVRGERLSGALDLDTVSGDVELTASGLPAVHVKTISANVSLQTSLGTGPYTFNSVSGEVRLTLPADSRCTAELHSVSGDLITIFPVSSYSRTAGSQIVALQGGGVPIAMHSVSGNLSLDCEGGLPAAAEAQGLSVEERRELLEGIERGELTVDEALTKLKK